MIPDRAITQALRRSRHYVAKEDSDQARADLVLLDSAIDLATGRSKTMPHASLADVQESPDAEPDNHNVYGSWPEVVEVCAKSPVGQHQYSVSDDFVRCVHCNAESGID